MSNEHDTIEGKNGSPFGDLIKKFFTKVPNIGDTVVGKVIAVENGEIRIDVEGLTTGVIRGPELFSESKEFSDIALGDEVEATVIDQENEDGEMELSFRIAGHERVWDRMRQYMTDHITLKGKIIQANKGGLMMKVDALTGFMPVSQLSPENYPRVPGGDKNKILEHLKIMIGKEIDVQIIDVNQKEEKLIVSEKAVWEDDQKSVLESYKIGDVVKGEISALTSFGAFMKFGEGLEGLIHISEIAWQRIDHPRDVLKIGQSVEAQIIDLNKSKIYLSIKRLMEDPWKRVKEKYAVGTVVEGQIHKVEPFGLMIRLDEDIHGLAHISELSPKPMTEKDIKEKFVVGDTHRFEIITIEPAEHRLGLKLGDGSSPKKQKAAESEAAAKEDSAPAQDVSQELESKDEQVV
ncbi:MAG TPA: 30S ribosomal protein S1 [Candidatus Magasanikbacteria bacterium]|nr:MAG: hypothetical protein A3I74_01765 [Candidatus Magasanikbacteria bacterium RIFCSPLOWO2_02_FULL_47_16]OGH79881.1 MAG: hypothetical protein A3C10_00265 [Candidatus Magasanikbacteria bacterium RIFCSPHIGHO2_02_FULL_48_18]HAZ28208.1 30S ribosomal protein S1 [Candidatus Magasanikbacteria bacterium]